MKLYATTTSNRASKGQGGDELVISIFDEHQEQVASILVLPREKGMLDNKVRMFIRAFPKQVAIIHEDISRKSEHYEKAKQKKGDHPYSKDCDCTDCKYGN